MKKIKKFKHGKSKLSTWKSIGILLGLVTLFLLLVNSKIILNNFVASPNINKITEVDSSTAKTDLERKAAEEFNEAADKADKAKTEKQKIKTTADLLIAGTTYQKVTELKQGSSTDATEYDKVRNEAIETLKNPKRGDLGNNVPHDPLITTDKGGNLTLTETAIKSYISDSPSSPKSNDKTTDLDGSACPGINSGIFGCPYEPGFFYTGDEKCGTSSVAGYYCWGNDKDGYKLYVINLPATQNEYSKRLSEAEGKLGNYSGDGSPESKKAYINSLGIYDTATVKKLSEQLIAKNTPPAGGDDGGGVGLSDVEKIAKNTCNKQGYVYDESGKKCTLKLLKPLTMSEKECHTQHPGYVYGADGSCKPNILLTPAQKAVALEACKAGLQDLGGTKTYVTCDSKAVTTRGVQSYNFCTGGGEFIHDYGCAEKGVGEVVNPNGVYTGGESVKPGEESKCIYDAIGGKCNYSTGNTKTKPPLVDRAIAQSPANPAGDTNNSQTTVSTRIVNSEKDCNTDEKPHSRQVAGDYLGSSKTEIYCEKINSEAGNSPENTARIVSIAQGGIGAGAVCAGAIILTAGTGGIAWPTLAGCALIGAGTGIAIGELQKPDQNYQNNAPIGTECGLYIKGISMKSRCSQVCPRDDQGKLKYSNYNKSTNTYKCGSVDEILNQRPDDKSSLNTTSDPSVPQVAQTGTTALDTGPLVSNPVVTNPAGQPAVNVPVTSVPEAIDTPPNGLSSKGSGNCIRRGNTYCDGARMYELYSWYRDNDGWWNEDSDFTPAEFAAMMLVIESGGDKGLLNAITTASANQLWGKGNPDRPPYCTSQANCEAGVLNFTGAYMQSAGMRYNNLSNDGIPEDVSTWESYYKSLAKDGVTLDSLANKIVYNQSPTTISINDPTDWGAPTSKAGDDPDVQGRGECPVYYENKDIEGGDIVYSIAQKNAWDNGACQ